VFGVRCSGGVLLCSLFGSDVVFCSVFGWLVVRCCVLFVFDLCSGSVPERVFVLCLCSCSGVGCSGVCVRVRLNTCCVRNPARAEHLFVFGERCSGAALFISNSWTTRTLARTSTAIFRRHNRNKLINTTMFHLHNLTLLNYLNRFSNTINRFH